MYSSYEILQKALEKEQQAYDFYATLAAGCPSDELRILLEKLRDEESRHIHMIKNMLTQVKLGHEPL